MSTGFDTHLGTAPVIAPSRNRGRNHHRRVAVVGAGSWGTTFGKILSDAGCQATILARRAEQAQEIHIAGRNSQYLPGVNLPAALAATHDPAEALQGAELVFFAVPSQTLRETIQALERHLKPDAVLVSLVKGVEQRSTMRMSEVIIDALGCAAHRVGVVSGPNIALEIAREQPTGAVVACASLEVATRIATACSAPYFRSYVSNDVIGTELGGVLKNLIALAIGIVDGVGYGENTQAAIITRGLAEMSEFAAAFGAEMSTISGLAGLGDLIATCNSPLSRNNMAGRLIGQGFSLDETKQQMQQVAEGITSTPVIRTLARQRGIVMPIVEQVHMVLEGTMTPQSLGPHLATEDEVPQPELRLKHNDGRGAWQGLIKKLRQLWRG